MFEKGGFSQRLPKITEIVGLPKMVFFGSTRFSELVGFPKIFCVCFDKSSTGRISQISKDVGQCSNFPEVSEGYQRCSVFRISRISEDILYILLHCSTCRISRISENVRVKCSIFPDVLLPKMYYMPNTCKSDFRRYSAHVSTVLDLPN